MTAYPGMDYWSAYALPVPTRKWLIKRYNKRMDELEKKSSKTPSSDAPLNNAQKRKMLNDAAQMRSDPSLIAKTIGQSVRNK